MSSPPNPYPDWSGQWAAHRQPELAPRRIREGRSGALTRNTKPSMTKNQELRAKGIMAGDPPATCLPPGMPRVMKMEFPDGDRCDSEDYLHHCRLGEPVEACLHGRARLAGRTDCRSSTGIPIGKWHDENKDGVYDMLSIETRGIKGPRSIDSTGVVLHENHSTVVLEEIRRIDANTMEDKNHDGRRCFYQAMDHQSAVQPCAAKDIVWVEDVCAEGNRHIKLGEEWYFINQDDRYVSIRRASDNRGSYRRLRVASTSASIRRCDVALARNRTAAASASSNSSRLDAPATAAARPGLRSHLHGSRHRRRRVARAVRRRCR